MALFDKIRKNKEEVEVISMEKEEFEAIVTENLYSQSDDLNTTLGKYKNLVSLSEKPLEKSLKPKLHDAMLVYVNSINPLTEKADILNFLTQTMQYTRTSTVNDALNVAAGLGIKAVKAASFIGDISTFGMTKGIMDQAEQLTKKALTTNTGELAAAWSMKLKEQIQLAKKTYGGLFGGDKAFINQLKSLEKQMAHK